MKLRRDNSELAAGLCIGVFVAGCAGFMVLLAVKSASPLHHAKERRTTEASRGGPVFIEGRASAPKTVRSPSSREGIAWAGHAGRMEGSKSYRFVSYCDLTALDGLEVNGLTLRSYDVPSVSVRGMPQDDYKLTVDFDVDSAQHLPVPAAVSERCPDMPRDVYWQEVVVPSDAVLTVSGCVHGKSPHDISPCGDDVDFVSTSPVQEVLDRNRKEVRRSYLTSGLFVVFGLGLITIVAARARTLVAKERS